MFYLILLSLTKIISSIIWPLALLLVGTRHVKTTCSMNLLIFLVFQIYYPTIPYVVF